MTGEKFFQRKLIVEVGLVAEIQRLKQLLAK